MNLDTARKTAWEATKWLAALVITIVVTGWIKGEQLKGLDSLAKLKVILTLKCPFWLVLLLGAVASWCGWQAYSLWRRRRINEGRAKVMDMRHTVNAVLKQKVAELEAKVADMQSKEPRLHVSWHPNQTFWAIGRTGVGPGAEPLIQIGGWAHISTSNTHQELILTSAYLDGTEPVVMLTVKVPPHRPIYTQLFTFVIPVTAKAGEPLRTRLIVVDHKNRKHVLEEHKFRWVGTQQQIDEAIEAGKEEPPPPPPLLAQTTS